MSSHDESVSGDGSKGDVSEGRPRRRPGRTTSKNKLTLGKRFQKLTKRSKIIIASVVAVLAVALPIAVNSFSLWDKIRNFITWRKEENVCQNIHNIAREYARKGDFDYSLKILNGNVEIYKGVKVLEQCTQNSDVNLLRYEVDLLGVASRDYQFNIRSKSQGEGDVGSGGQALTPPGETLDDSLKRIESSLRVIENLTGPHQPAELYILSGEVDNLRDFPGEAVKKYQKAIASDGQNAFAYNTYGLTILKWRIGYTNWAEEALRQFNLATTAQKDYVWPHINKAKVFLTLVRDELNKGQPYNVEDTDGTQPNLGRAESWLKSAKESLDAADKVINLSTGKDGGISLQDLPVRHIMQARYYLVRGQVYRQEGDREVDANQSFYQAVDHLKMAKNDASSFVEASLLLGLTYEELAQGGEASDKMLELALGEFRSAFSKDDSSLEASMKLAYRLHLNQGDKKSKEEEATVIGTGLKLVGRFREDLNTRIGKTTDEYALHWLNKRRKEADIWEANFKKMQKILGAQH